MSITPNKHTYTHECRGCGYKMTSNISVLDAGWGSHRIGANPLKMAFYLMLCPSCEEMFHELLTAWIKALRLQASDHPLSRPIEAVHDDDG